jgi:hypothetical protein
MIDEQRIETLEDKVDDLRWRMNAVCNILTKKFGDEIAGTPDELYMREDVNIQPLPKYAIGDRVWWLDGRNTITSGVIIEGQVSGRGDGINYLTDNKWCMFETQLYPSREDLIDAQVNYWCSLREPNKSCKHESDSYYYITNHKPQKHSRKCKKCGAFYK